jgi:hypothetical protein
MKNLTLAGIGAAALLAGAWYLFRPELLFVDRSVAEAFPDASSAGSEAGRPAPLLAGRFHGVAHETRGTAEIFELRDGHRLLRLSDFETSNGPDVRVYLVAAPDANNSQTVTEAGFVELGPLKGNRGDQNYDVPAGVDLGRHRAVTIWCKRFGVNFATAPLAAADRSG